MGFTPHLITIAVGEDIASKIMSFSQQGPRAVCILSANGVVSIVTLCQPATSGGTVTYEVAIFVVLAMTLRRKLDILVNLLLKLKDNPKYHGHEKFPLIVWVVGQASQGDLVAGMYAWVHYLLPLISGKPNVNSQSRNLALQLVERILSGPKARSILFNGAVRKGERLVPPSALDVLMRATFPAQSARVKATERFEATYPTLKELALAGSPGTKTTKQASQQLLPSTMKAMQENKRSRLKLSRTQEVQAGLSGADGEDDF